MCVSISLGMVGTVYYYSYVCISAIRLLLLVYVLTAM